VAGWGSCWCNLLGNSYKVNKPKLGTPITPTASGSLLYNCIGKLYISFDFVVPYTAVREWGPSGQSRRTRLARMTETKAGFVPANCPLGIQK